MCWLLDNSHVKMLSKCTIIELNSGSVVAQLIEMRGDGGMITIAKIHCLNGILNDLSGSKTTVIYNLLKL